MTLLKNSFGYFIILFVSIFTILFIKDYNENKLIYLLFSLFVNFFYKNFFTKFSISEFLLLFICGWVSGFP